MQIVEDPSFVRKIDFTDYLEKQSQKPKDMIFPTSVEKELFRDNKEKMSHVEHWNKKKQEKFQKPKEIEKTFKLSDGREIPLWNRKI